MWSANCRCDLTTVFPDYKADIHSDCVEYQRVPCGVSKYQFLKPVWPIWKRACRNNLIPPVGAEDSRTCVDGFELSVYWPVYGFIRISNKKKETAVIWAVGVSLLTAESHEKLPHNYISGLVFGKDFLTRHPTKDSRLHCFTQKWYMLNRLYKYAWGMSRWSSIFS
jgi:hypothetical protein